MRSFLVIALSWAVLVPFAASAQQRSAPHPHGELPPGLDCASCHTALAWTPLKENPDFDHNRLTGFPLLGAHNRTRCASCHLELRFDEPKLQADDCASCHVDVH
ncbi:cytochrome c3 family protein, partial [Rhodocaloribacter sp.]